MINHKFNSKKLVYQCSNLGKVSIKNPQKIRKKSAKFDI